MANAKPLRRRLISGYEAPGAVSRRIVNHCSCSWHTADYNIYFCSIQPTAKRRRGPKRDFPCVYCVRRLANNPGWACTEATGMTGPPLILMPRRSD